MKLINTKTHLIGTLDIGLTTEKTEILDHERVVKCLDVYVEKNGVLAEIYTYKTIKELINAGWKDY